MLFFLCRSNDIDPLSCGVGASFSSLIPGQRYQLLAKTTMSDNQSHMLDISTPPLGLSLSLIRSRCADFVLFTTPSDDPALQAHCNSILASFTRVYTLTTCVVTREDLQPTWPDKLLELHSGLAQLAFDSRERIPAGLSELISRSQFLLQQCSGGVTSPPSTILSPIPRTPRALASGSPPPIRDLVSLPPPGLHDLGLLQCCMSYRCTDVCERLTAPLLLDVPLGPSCIRIVKNLRKLWPL